MSYSILIVDDSSTTRAVIKRTMSMSGLELGSVFEAENGEEALRLIREEWIDLVFTDLNMPVMGGVEMIRQMAQDDLLATVPVVVISSIRDQATKDELQGLGVKAYLTKPFRPEEFRDALLEVLGGGSN